MKSQNSGTETPPIPRCRFSEKDRNTGIAVKVYLLYYLVLTYSRLSVKAKKCTLWKRLSTAPSCSLICCWARCCVVMRLSSCVSWSSYIAFTADSSNVESAFSSESRCNACSGSPRPPNRPYFASYRKCFAFSAYQT